MSEIKALEELREWSRWLDHTYAIDDGTAYNVYSYKPYDGMKSCGELMREKCAEAVAEIAERFMELPVDADGVPIRVGDLIEFGDKGERLEVTHFGWTKHGDPTIAYRRPNGTLDCSCIGGECRHVKPRTLENALADFSAKVLNSGHQWGLDAQDAIAECADEIRELMGVGK